MRRQDRVMQESMSMSRAASLPLRVCRDFQTSNSTWRQLIGTCVDEQVCGSDGKDYPNECQAKCNGVEKKCEGTCPCGGKPPNCIKEGGFCDGVLRTEATTATSVRTNGKFCCAPLRCCHCPRLVTGHDTRPVNRPKCQHECICKG